MPTVTALYVFPVKGLKGISLPSAHVCETGEIAHNGRAFIKGHKCSLKDCTGTYVL